jgi:hypothetical protein
VDMVFLKPLQDRPTTHTVPASRHTHKRGLTLDKKSLTSFKVLIILLGLHGKYSLGGLQGSSL